MAQEKYITPEKQLLNLIEDSKTKAKDVQAHAIKHYSLSLFSFGAWLGRLAFFKDGFKKWSKGAARPYQLDIKVINKFLELGIFILAFYLISLSSTSIMNLKKTPNLKFKVQEERRKVSLSETAILKKAASSYLEKVMQRDIFKLGAKGAIQAAGKGPSSKVLEATKNFKLVGISWSDDPDAMIEDAKALRTFFVKRGQMLGEVKVQAIFKDKVVLSYQGEEIELK